MGYGDHLMRANGMDFVEALVDLARESPARTKPGRERRGVPYCTALWNSERTASNTELHTSLDQTFGAEFLNARPHDPSGEKAAEKHKVTQLLTTLKLNFSFYYKGASTVRQSRFESSRTCRACGPP